MALLARRVHVLPRAGGVLDQDYWEMTMVMVGLDALAEKEAEEVRKTRSKR